MFKLAERRLMSDGFNVLLHFLQRLPLSGGSMSQSLPLA